MDSPEPAETPDDETAGQIAQEQIEQERLEIDGQCLDGRRNGETFRQMAARLDITPGRAHAGYKRALALEPITDQDEERRNMTAQIDRLILRALTIAVTDKSPDRNLRAMRVCVELMTRKSDLLGLDVPVTRTVKVEVSESALEQEQRQLEIDLAAAGYDISKLPSVDDFVAIIEAHAVEKKSPDDGQPALSGTNGHVNDDVDLLP